jgi:nicotinate-nucleotide adenylyltransferase
VKIGLFGGTFDPPHSGHLIVAQDAALALSLDRVLFMPAAQPPHKLGRAMSPAAIRAEMLGLAIAENPLFAFSSLELEREGPSYTVDTLERLTREQPGVQWTLLIGADQYAEFELWREPAVIRSRARIAVLARGGGSDGTAPVAAAGIPPLEPLEHGDVRVQVTRIDISATQIRARVAAGQPIRYMVPAAVEQFIFEHGLYSRNGSPMMG